MKYMYFVKNLNLIQTTLTDIIRIRMDIITRRDGNDDERECYTKLKGLINDKEDKPKGLM